ncbi:hypothetical protein N1851_004110 [Merluccius polli]|uniref:Uncharacterized protein n=1 Tax=Merluccius polli TaxID=89951 RepID=A0AA47N8T7_MERPO|nr:hypothetical protein N1851_004110 [Merluccius polli]
MYRLYWPAGSFVSFLVDKYIDCTYIVCSPTQPESHQSDSDQFVVYVLPCVPVVTPICILAKIRRLDSCAIVRWNGWFIHGGNYCLEFELLHMSLCDFLRR